MMEYATLRKRTIDNAFGFSEFHRILVGFMSSNNMAIHEIHEIIRLINHFYYYGIDVENVTFDREEPVKRIFPRPIPGDVAILCPACKQNIYQPKEKEEGQV